VEAIKAIGGDATAVWVGNSPLIAACAGRTGLPTLNIQRELAPGLFELNRLGAWNGHIPVTAVNSAILALAALLYGHDSIAFANERSASAATLEYDGQQVNHQWSKGFAFEAMLGNWLHTHVAADLDYFSLLRPYSELAITRAFARLTPYFDAFSSCNRNFKLLGPRPADRWCGQCPKCHFVFLRWRRSCPSRACWRSSAATCWTTRRRRRASMRCWNTRITSRSNAWARAPRRAQRCTR
jgi:hypothetical protein